MFGQIKRSVRGSERRVIKVKRYKGKYEAKLEFLEWAWGFIENIPCMGGMDIFSKFILGSKCLSLCFVLHQHF